MAQLRRKLEPDLLRAATGSGVGGQDTATRDVHFLGFTHIWARMPAGRFWVRRITIKKRMQVAAETDAELGDGLVQVVLDAY